MNTKMTYTVDKIKQQILNLIGDNVELDVPKNPEFGDFTTNIAMIKAKELKKNPREIAQNIISSMNFDNTLIERAEIAGAGFINFYLKPNWLANVLQDIFEAGDDYGRVNVGAGSKINLEYVSANPTGPMHMGNARGGALGDTLAKSLSFAGFDVTREFYLNDAGNQIEKFANSLLARYFQLSDESYPFPEDGYQGDDIKILAKEFADSNPQLMTSINNKDENSINDLKLQLINFGLAKNIAKIHEVLGNYGVEYDVWFKESQLHESNAVTECIDKLKSLDATYEKEGALWIKGDEKDEVLV
ncbi:MAG: arginine--tRNA ligase, partial [Clostridiales bacterium]|nr:arginine--tRNA ligase [Clostridiales bacterium]